MIVTDRDRQIVLTIGRFGQVSFSHIFELVFEPGSSRTSLDRAVTRLLKSRHIARIERRMVGGSGAGSGQYVYQLGSMGWAMCRREGRYWPYRAVSYHTLAIADAYVALKQFERTGRIDITGLSTEPDTWLTMAGADLRPDMHVELAIPERKQLLSLWIELDMGTERQKQIKEKLARYWHAYQNADEQTMPTFPAILFLVPDDERAKELTWIIERGDPNARALFMVGKLQDFPKFLFT